MGRRIMARWLIGTAAAICTTAALADDLADMDALSRATDAVAPGLELARNQSAGGDLLGALATLERINIQYPTAKEAQLLHASLLCRLDDKAGAATEFSHLKRRDYARNVWDEAIAPCAPPAAARAEPAKAEPARTQPAPSEPDSPKPKPRRRIDGI